MEILTSRHQIVQSFREDSKIDLVQQNPVKWTFFAKLPTLPLKNVNGDFQENRFSIRYFFPIFACRKNKKTWSKMIFISMRCDKDDELIFQL